MNYKDSKHIFADKLKGGAELHRFKNEAGYDYSAIYVDGEEVWSRERKDENEMVTAWNERGWKSYSNEMEIVIKGFPVCDVPNRGATHEVEVDLQTSTANVFYYKDSDLYDIPESVKKGLEFIIGSLLGVVEMKEDEKSEEN